MSKAIIIEQIGSAIFHPKNRIKSEEIMTPTLPEKKTLFKLIS